MSEEEVSQAISLLLTEGYHIDKEAFSLLSTISKTKNPVRLVELILKKLKASAEKSFFINRTLLEETAKDAFSRETEIKPNEIPESKRVSIETLKVRNTFYPYAKDIKSEIKILEDPTTELCSIGTIEGYLEYFQDRFKRIVKLLKQRMDTRDAATIKDVFRAVSHSEVKIFCIVTEKRESKYGILLKVEDMEASISALILRNSSRELLEKAKALLPDQVVCLNLTKSRKNLIIVKDLFFPDIPQKKPRKAAEEVYAALISDLHVGSQEFMREEMSRFLLWLNGKYGAESQKAIASHVKYVVIAGDLVDGVGVYPNQIKELTVRDLSKQYKLVAKFLEQIPDYMELIIIPGNHDASRKALPQPALPKEYSEPLHETRNVLSLGNPSTVNIHGLDFLLYHGRSLDDVLATAVDMNFHSPERAMRLLLLGRHLAPIYGQRTSIAPGKRDFLVIERVPDVFHAGHVHVMKYDYYRGTLLVNSGAWQKQTNYQRKLGLKPTPGIIPIVNLQTLSVLPMDFA